MILSRGVPLFRNVARTITPKKSLQKVPVRFGHGHEHASGYYYRDIADPSKADRYMSQVLGGVMWWWIFWNSWHMWGHIVGEFEYPVPSEWTDEELGIPAD